MVGHGLILFLIKSVIKNKTSGRLGRGDRTGTIRLRKERPGLPSHSAFSRAWRGEIGLYRAAYGLGGLGLAFVSLLGDALLSISAFAGGVFGCLSYMAGGAGELAFAWVSIVVTWRAAQRGRPDGRAYGPMAVGLAFAFVGIQFLLITAWTGWSGLAALGVAPEPDGVLFRTLTVAVGSDCAGVDQLCKALAIVNY